MIRELKKAMEQFNKIEGKHGEGYRDGWAACFRVLTSFTSDIEDALEELNCDDKGGKQ